MSDRITLDAPDAHVYFVCQRRASVAVASPREIIEYVAVRWKGMHIEEIVGQELHDLAAKVADPDQGVEAFTFDRPLYIPEELQIQEEGVYSTYRFRALDEDEISRFNASYQSFEMDN